MRYSNSKKAQIFFIIAKQNVQRFIDMTGYLLCLEYHYMTIVLKGYGNAAGLLYQNGFLTKGFTPDDGDTDDDSSDDDDQERERRVNLQLGKMKLEK